MAGGKETPRQKMIGLMYLVLLALLALQVGAEIMVKFQQLNNSMEALVTESREKSQLTLEAIDSKAKEDGRDNIKQALKQAQTLHSKSAEIIDYIGDIKQTLIVKTGGYQEGTTVPMGMKDADAASILLVGQEGNKGKGYDLENKLDEYVITLNGVNKEVSELLGQPSKDYPNMTLSGKEDPQFAKDEAQRTKDWVQLAFDHTPMIAALAYLTERQARVANYEAEILQKIKNSLGATDLKFDEVFPMASAESRVVAAGTYYEADLFITARSSAASFAPIMTMNGSSVKVENGIGKVKFKAGIAGGTKVKGNDNMVQKSWKGVIKMKDGTGKEQKYEETFTYFVSKPVIQIQSASVDALYRNCGNELSVQVPALGAAYKPDFKISGARLIKSGRTGEITIVPTDPKVKLSVYNDGSHIGDKEFQVKLVPKPELVVYNSSNKPADTRTGETASKLRSITVRAIPDQGFASLLKKDSQYRVTKWVATLVRGKRPAAAPATFSGPDASLTSLMSNAREGDRLMIEIKEVQRRTYTGGTETVNVGTPIINVPLK